MIFMVSMRVKITKTKRGACEKHLIRHKTDFSQQQTKQRVKVVENLHLAGS